MSTDKVRKIPNTTQSVPHGPGHAGLWVNSNGQLMLNVSGTPAQVGGGGGGSLTVLGSDPGSPANGEVWVVSTGVSPAATLAIKARLAGVTVVLASVTY